jgi:hypothetical protein
MHNKGRRSLQKCDFARLWRKIGVKYMNRKLILGIVMLVLMIGSASAVKAVTGNQPQCNDGIDNDGDGLIDYPADPGCYDYTDNSEVNVGLPQCSDLIDNDGDGRIDYPADLGCTSPQDNSEADGGQIPEFPTVALPIMSVLGLMFLMSKRKHN